MKHILTRTDRALSSYSTLTQSLHPASTNDITSYQNWISKHAPVADPESAFIHHTPRDQRALPSHQTNATSNSSNATSHSEIPTDLFPQQVTPLLIAIFILFASIIVFKFVPQIFARLVIALVTGLASYCTMPPATRGKLWERNGNGWKRAVGAYVTVMVTLAIVVD